MPADSPAGQVVQERGLAHPRLAPQHGDVAPAAERLGQEPVERLALASASKELRGWAGILARRRPPPRSTTPRRAAISRAYISVAGPEKPRRPRVAPGCLPGATQQPKRKSDS